jgi:hypothetical protein
MFNKKLYLAIYMTEIRYLSTSLQVVTAVNNFDTSSVIWPYLGLRLSVWAHPGTDSKITRRATIFMLKYFSDSIVSITVFGRQFQLS